MKNTLQNNNFRFELPDNQSTRDFQWQVTDVSIPSISISETSISMPKLQNLRMPASAVTYGDVDIEFLMDADFQAYNNVYKWMMSIINTTSNHQDIDPTNTVEKDAILYIIDATGDRIVTAFKFFGLFPTNLAPLNFTYGEAGAIDAVTCNVTFSFREMKLLDNQMTALIS